MNSYLLRTSRRERGEELLKRALAAPEATEWTAEEKRSLQEFIRAERSEIVLRPTTSCK